MKKCSFVVLLAIVATSFIHAQSLQSFQADNGKWGFKTAAGVVVIPAKYTAVSEDGFRGGLEAVTIEGKPDDAGLSIDDAKWGFIDSTGKVVVQLKYDRVQPFTNGIAKVSSNDKWGLVNDRGIEVIAPHYNDMDKVADGMIAVQAGDLWGYCNTEGREVIKPRYARAFHFSEGLAAVAPKENSYLLGFIDKLGNMVIQPQFAYTGIKVFTLNEDNCFRNGQAKVCKNDITFYIDTKGSTVQANFINTLYNLIDARDKNFSAFKASAYTGDNTAGRKVYNTTVQFGNKGTFLADYDNNVSAFYINYDLTDNANYVALSKQISDIEQVMKELLTLPFGYTQVKQNTSDGGQEVAIAKGDKKILSAIAHNGTSVQLMIVGTKINQ